MSTAAQYDAMVVGGGHHGTIIACYLARAGLKVAVFERNFTSAAERPLAAAPRPAF